jgi:predicted nucleic acid-binding protein
MYVDSNVLIFAALDSGRIGADANRFLRLIREGRIRASVSPMVLNEVMRAIQKAIGREQANRLTAAIMLLPFSWLDIGYSCIPHAQRHFKKGLDPTDAFHAAIMNDYNISIIISEDAHFDKVEGIKRISIKGAVNGK